MDIYDDAMWLIDLVENLLSVSRLEDGRMNLHISTELIDEVVVEALRHVDRRCAQYNLRVQNSEEYLLAQIDAKLIVQVLINLINNAIKYTPPGTEIDIAWERRGGWLQVSVSDTGPGFRIRQSPISSICFTAPPIRSPTAAAAWGSAWPCASRSSMPMAEKLQSQTAVPMEPSSHFLYLQGR